MDVDVVVDEAGAAAVAGKIEFESEFEFAGPVAVVDAGAGHERRTVVIGRGDLIVARAFVYWIWGNLAAMGARGYSEPLLGMCGFSVAEAEVGAEYGCG